MAFGDEVERHAIDQESYSNYPVSTGRDGEASEEQDKSHSETPVSNILGVFGLSMYTTERTLQELYEAYGPVVSAKLIYDRDSRRSRGFGFVTFEDEASAEKALKATNGMELDGRPIRVDYSRTRGPHDPTPGRYMGKPSRTPRYPRRDSYYGEYDRDYRRGYHDDRYPRSSYRGPRDDDRYYSRPPSRPEYSNRRDDYSREYRRGDGDYQPRYHGSGRSDSPSGDAYGEYSRRSRAGRSD